MVTAVSLFAYPAPKTHKSIGLVLSDGKVDMTGKDVNNLNYRDIFAQFLKTLSKDRKVLVVDHILDSDVYDDNIYVNLQLNGTSKLVHGYE